ncbi:SET domain-containing protein [Fusarium circinatum]|uniref:SET domain-containing protein n=1 Tax=Fusarium circinatum TaxID=48490 RepID=A0A8H5U4U4_FUSCI|nr:SET domain-containing protein [Fusarium circinatum]
MGIDAGFDMVPQLSRTDTDYKAWDLFINMVKERYKTDKRMEINANYIFFNAGEGPILPFEGFKFMRFSSKVSGSTATTTGVWDIIQAVTQIAKSIFGSRVRDWSEAFDHYGYYKWDEVHASIKSYDKVDGWAAPETSASPSANLTSSEQISSSLCEVQSIPGRGKGLIALRKITMGTRVLIEKPILQTRNAPPASLEPIIARDLKSLPKAKQRQFLSLHNNFPGKYPFSGIMRTNALPCGSGASVGAVYPTICFINHSCRANAHNSWNEALEQETIHAIRDIEPGEEITISYDHGGPSSHRKPWLKEKFGFDCDCFVCRLPLVELEKSDKRRKQIQQLDQDIGDPFRMMSSPSASLLDCRSLLQVLKEEFEEDTSILGARANYDAFQIAIVHGDLARGAVFADRAFQVRLICEGEDSLSTKRMQRLAEDPKSHPSFGVHSVRWKTKKGQVPQELMRDEFENWLWRQG